MTLKTQSIYHSNFTLTFLFHYIRSINKTRVIINHLEDIQILVHKKK